MSTVHAALFTLSGGGDTNIFLAPKSALDWCYSAEVGSSHLPDQVREDLTPFLTSPDSLSEDLDITITPGSADNDAALFLAAVCQEFDSPIQAVRFAEKQGYRLDDDDAYEGYIY